MTYLLFRLFNNVFNWVFRMCENERNSDEFVLNHRNGSLILLHRKKKTDRKLTIVAILQTLDFIVDSPAILLSSRHSCKFCKIQSTAVRRIMNIIDDRAIFRLIFRQTSADSVHVWKWKCRAGFGFSIEPRLWSVRILELKTTALFGATKANDVQQRLVLFFF